MSTTARRAAIAASLAVAMLAGPVTARAQQQAPTDLPSRSLEDLLNLEVESVEGAARHTQRTTEAPASVTVLTANDIETFGWRTLAEALRSVRGFHVTYDRNYSYIGVRAFGRPTDYNNRVLVLIDGHRLNDSIYDGALVGTELPLDMALVDRIEVVRGPGSALYGTSAFFAVVNVITKHGAHVNAGDGAIEVDSLRGVKVRASHGWSGSKERDLLLSATRYRSDGQETLFYPEFAGDANQGLVVGGDHDAATDFLASARLGRLQLRAVVGDREKHIPTGSWGTDFSDTRYYTRDTRAWGSVGYNRDLGKADISVGGYVDHYRYSGAYPFGRLFDDGSVADAIGTEATVRWQSGRHLFTTGAEQRTNVRQNQFYGIGNDWTIYDRRHSQEVAAYGQDEIALSSRMTAVIGARYDWWSLKGGTGRPRLGLVYRTAGDTAIKALYGEAYRAPNLYEMYYFTAQIRRSNNLGPEVARTSELVFERRVGRRVRATATAYYTRISSLIDPMTQADDSIVYVNNEEARSQGVELEADSRWSSGLLLRASFTRQHAYEAATREHLSNAPRSLATLHAAMPFWRRQVVLASESLFVADREALGGEALPSYWMTNATATYRPVRMPLTIGASVYNVFDAHYAHPVGVEFRQTAIPQDGRTFALRLAVKF
jgi:iron complex outermembrane receptor protein